MFIIRVDNIFDDNIQVKKERNQKRKNQGRDQVHRLVVVIVIKRIMNEQKSLEIIMKTPMEQVISI